MKKETKPIPPPVNETFIQSCQIVHFRTRFSAIWIDSVQFQNPSALKKFSANFSAFKDFTKYKEIIEENQGFIIKLFKLIFFIQKIDNLNTKNLKIFCNTFSQFWNLV